MLNMRKQLAEICSIPDLREVLDLVFFLKDFSFYHKQSLKYQRFTPTGCKDIGIRKFESLATT